MSDQKKPDLLSERYNIWSKDLEKTLEKRPERKKEFINNSGVPIKRLYTPLDIGESDYISDLGSITFENLYYFI